MQYLLHMKTLYQDILLMMIKYNQIPLLEMYLLKQLKHKEQLLIGFTGNTFESVVDRTKSQIPNWGPSKIKFNKVRIENDKIRPEFKFISR